MNDKPQGISFGESWRRTRRTQRADRRVNHVNDVCWCRELDGANIAGVIARAVERQVIEMPDAIVFVAQVAPEGLRFFVGNHHIGSETDALYRVRPGRDTG